MKLDLLSTIPIFAVGALAFYGLLALIL